MKKYSSYKPSGEEYIGDIPTNWECYRLGMLGVFSSSGIDKKTMENESIVRMVNYTDIIQSRKYIPIQTGEKEYMVVSTPKSKLEEHRLFRGDMVFIPSSETKDDLGYSSLIDFEENDVVYSYHILRFRTSKEIYHYFKKYLINHHSVLSQFSRESKGTTRQIIGRNVFNNVKVVLPTIQEQEQIVKYLDEKTSIIDKLISTKERKIDLLKEQRSSLINEVITKGLDPNVKMKDSGVEWIGDIPENFKIITLKKLLQTNNLEFQDGNHGSEYPNPEEFMKIGVPFIKPRDIQNDKIIWDGCDRLPFERCKRFRIGFSNNGDILLVNRGGSIGKVCYVDDFNNEFPYFLINPQVTYLRGKKELTPKYIYYTTISDVFRCGIDLILGHGSTFPFLGLSNMSDFKMVFPPIKEQQQIVQHLDKQTKEIDDLVHLEQKKIETLKEYRQSLISEVITGKIKVVE
jgi:type I restriction enzyme S subunit